MAAPTVTVHVASLNTTRVTELCIRSMRRFAGRDFDLVVGDAGSTDGSLDMLRDFEARGWLRLEVAPGGRRHPDWMDGWLAACTTRYAVFSDSDVEYRAGPWLADMVETAQRNGAALVCGRMQWPPDEFVHPVTGAAGKLAPRPTPWLNMLDVEQVRGVVDASFRYAEVEDPSAFGGRIAYDVAAKYYETLCAAGLGWAEMPPEWQYKYRHFGGLTWLGAKNRQAAPRVRAKQLVKLGIVEAHLRRARRRGWGTTIQG